MNYELYNHTTIRPFKGDKLMLSLIKGNELILSPFKGDELMLSPFKGDKLMLRPFKGDKLMHNECCDGNHCGDPMSLITSATR